MTYGVTDAGFLDKPEEVILEEIETSEKASIDPGLDVSAVSPAGQLNAIFAAKCRELWEVGQALYSGIDPDAATKALLTALSAITGTLRRDATKTSVTGRLNVNAGVTVPAGSIASVDGNPDARFETLVAVTNSGGSPADFQTTLEALTAGSVVVNAGTLTVIETPVTGWNSITNDTDGTLGAAEESDEDLRLRREAELRQAAAGSLGALLANLLLLDDVISVVLFENTGSVTNGDGLPPHSFEAVVWGGTDQDVVDEIWSLKPAGIATYGNSSETALDAVNVAHTVYFSRPTEKPIYETFELDINDDPLRGPVYPTDGDDQVKAAISAWGQANLVIGSDLVLSRQYATLLAIDGVLDVTAIKAGFSASPSGTSNLSIEAREIGTLTTTNMVVTTTVVVPS